VFGNNNVNMPPKAEKGPEGTKLEQNCNELLDALKEKAKKDKTNLDYEKESDGKSLTCNFKLTRPVNQPLFSVIIQPNPKSTYEVGDVVKHEASTYKGKKANIGNVYFNLLREDPKKIINSTVLNTAGELNEVSGIQTGYAIGAAKFKPAGEPAGDNVAEELAELRTKHDTLLAWAHGVKVAANVNNNELQ